MAFKYAGTQSATVMDRKLYFYPVLPNQGPGSQIWEYVTTDAFTAVDASGYFTDTTIIKNVRVGDIIRVFVVSSISDSRTIEADKAAGITHYTEHLVVSNNGTTLDISNYIAGFVAAAVADTD
jgi:hypothetical protein